MTQTILTTMADYQTFYNIGYWLIPALLAIWAIVMIVKKIMQGVKDTKEINQKIKELDAKEKGQTKEDDEETDDKKGRTK